MKVAAAQHVAVIVLDRPDPIGGLVQGNVLQPGFKTTVGQLEIPMRHGMTLGELARLAKTDLGLAVDLAVVPVAGWQRAVPLDETGLPFIAPSPNLRTLQSLYHYPGTCLFEGTNLSVGRGSDAPFQQIGAPWLDTTAVLSAMRKAGLPGVELRAVSFTPAKPGDGKFADTAVAGIWLTVTDRGRYDPTATAVHLLSVIRAAHPDRFGWIPAHFDRLAGTASLRAAVESGAPPGEIVRSWQQDLERFRSRRRPALIYPE
jgi:uncharacterized protein YbbC (DUF1343 family)